MGVMLALVVSACGGGGDKPDLGGGGGFIAGAGVLNCTVLATGSVFTPTFNVGFVYEVWLDGGNVYWYDTNLANGNGIIKSVPKSGGAVTTIVSDAGLMGGVAMDDSYIYWSSHNGGGAGQIRKVPKAGGAITVLASGVPAGSIYDVFVPNGVAVDSTYLYWGESVGGGAVRRVPKAGGTVVDINRGGGLVVGVALDSPIAPTRIFYSDGAVDGGTSSLFSIPLNGGARSTVAAGGVTGDFFIDGGFIYGASLANPTGWVFSVPLTGGATTILASNLQNPRGISSDANYVYYSGDQGNSAGGPGGIVKMAKGGGPIVGKGLCVDGATNTPYNTIYLAADASNIYLSAFPNGGAGAGPIVILKAPKP